MKKIFSLCFLAVFAVCALFGTAAVAKINEADFYSPWQFICRSNSGTTTAIVTLEAFADQNVIIDRIILNTDKENGILYIGHRGREATSFEATVTADAVINAGILTATYEAQVFGGTHPEIPLWVADKGWAVQITAEGTANVDLIVNGRRGTINPRQPSINSERGY